ncbi:hypothetical protein, partial [Polymorphospora rubra]
PAEDGGDADHAASAIADHPSITTAGVSQFAAVSVATPGGNAGAGTLPLPDLSAGGRLVATIPAPVTAACTAASQYSLQFVATVAAGSFTGDLTLVEWLTPGGTHVRWALIFTMSGSVLNWALKAYNAAGTETHVNGGAGQAFGAWRITATQAGGNISVRMYFASNFASSATVAGTLAGPARITANASGTTATEALPFGHLTVWPDADPTLPQQGDVVDSYGQSVRAPDVLPWQYEAAHLRLARLCAEEGVSFAAPTVAAEDVVRMGPQPAGTVAELLLQCAESDQGLVYEDGWGLGYLPRPDRYNAPVALTIAAAERQLGGDLAPATDDPNRRNIWTVSRHGGSSAQARDEDLVTLQGEIEGQTTVHHVGDGALEDHAAWWLRRHSAQEMRWPSLAINLHVARELAADWCAVRPGSRVQVTDPPAQAPPGVIDQLVVGATETWSGRRKWKAVLNLQPASPWLVAELDGAQDQRIATDDGLLAANVDQAAMVLWLSAPEGWTTLDGDHPLDLRLGGEQVRIAQTRASLEDRFARYAASGWGTADTGQTWATVGGSSSDYGVEGG